MTEAKYLGLTANELAKIASDIDAENAKLREQGARLFDRILELATENAKLRELIFDMLVDEERGHNDDDTYYEHVRLANGLGIEVRSRWSASTWTRGARTTATR